MTVYHSVWVITPSRLGLERDATSPRRTKLFPPFSASAPSFLQCLSPHPTPYSYGPTAISIDRHIHHRGYGAHHNDLGQLTRVIELALHFSPLPGSRNQVIDLTDIF